MRKRSPILGLLMVFFAAASPAWADQSVLLVLDASNSMSGLLRDGTVKMDAARAALARVVNALPPDVRLALRAYGNQYWRAENNCQDTELLVGFGEVAKVREEVLTASSGLRARGNTPLALVIELAARDLAPEAGTRLVVLVSDGVETCAGSPCAAARTLREGGGELVIHTVGFGVDQAARSELQCVADATGGRYFAAESVDELVAAIDTAAARAPTLVEAMEEENQETPEVTVDEAKVVSSSLLEVPAAAETPTTDNQVEPVGAAAEGSYVIGEGDVLRVSVWKDAELDRTLPVRPDGHISVPLLGDVKAAGRTADELRKILESRYAEFITKPEVSVSVTEVGSKKIFVLGEVAQPGVYELAGPTRLLQALAMAGGLTPFARQKRVVILRQEGDATQRLTVSVRGIASGERPQDDLLLRPGDTVIVP